VLVSSGHGLPLKDGKVYAGAGYYLNELTVPVRALMKDGYEITFANPKGKTPQMDVHSAVADFFGVDEARLQDYLKFRDNLTGLKNPTRISDVIASGLDQYDAVFVPGGHVRGRLPLYIAAYSEQPRSLRWPRLKLFR
jgi:putative intracellular protease/amidase